MEKINNKVSRNAHDPNTHSGGLLEEMKGKVNLLINVINVIIANNDKYGGNLGQYAKEIKFDSKDVEYRTLKTPSSELSIKVVPDEAL